MNGSADPTPAQAAVASHAMPVGTAYAVWTGAGAVCAALAGMLLMGEPATLSRLAAIGLVATGIAWLATAG